MADRNSRYPERRSTSLEQLRNYALIVLLVCFVVGVIAVIMTGSPRIAVGTIILGIFFGWLVYLGWYNQ